MVSKEDMKDMAELCKIKFSDKEIIDLQDEFNEVLEYVDQIKKVDTDRVGSTYYGNSKKQVLREDTVGPSLPRDEVIKNAPEEQYGYFKMLRVMD